MINSITSKAVREEGFAFIAALLLMLLLVSLGVLVFTLTGRDTRIAVVTVGEKKALAAAEAGVHSLLSNSNSLMGMIDGYTVGSTQVNPTYDPYAVFSVSSSATYPGAPSFIPMVGYQIGGGGGAASWGMATFPKSVTGTYTQLGSTVTIDVGVGYGPIESSTSQPAAGG